MKKVLYSLILSITALSMVSCDYHDPNDGKFNSDRESGWVEFAENGGLAQGIAQCGASNEIHIPLVLSAYVNESGLDVYYTITDVVGTSAGAINGYGRIPAGSLEGELVFTFPETQASAIEFNVTLTSTSKSSVRIGHPDSTEPQTFRVRVNVTNRDRFMGVYNVVETSSEGTFNYQSVVTAGVAENELVISNLFDTNHQSQTHVFINNDGTISFPALADNYLFTTSSDVDLYLDGIAGTAASSCEGVITLDFNLKTLAGGTAAGPVNTVLTRQ